ncbi:Villin headpiece domain-containing protein [Prochlorococcus marinus]|uniref:Villin headpiece domain-containing protein n=1 Tax=Prochlorococcus marinus TaxID=1219 RepID=UPI001ADC5D38|nr:Villin headpiece domain-containing protein [Prochlorococcus marinus]MBO8217443.1 Villin headpiece domain-containing protein [Prochlorococcus marinus XMU1405]MBW3040658.1 Villin headpiece domain-containing protein [Prochlorococcus marinus str. MU1405]MBW3048115.1 Villin headpiece domain-containing protein [Prochlorococcus marinus str. MU1406]
MSIKFYSKKILKFLGISFIVPFTLFEINSIDKQLKAEKNLIAASEEDIFLYRQMGASYLCIASKAEVDFNKGLTIASATFANVIIGKHGGAIKELGNAKLDEKKLYNAGTLQIVGSALNICPESIPNNIKNDYKKQINKLQKGSKK